MTTEFHAIFGEPAYKSEDLTAWVLKKREQVEQEPEPDDRDYDDVDLELYLEHYPDGDRDESLEY